MMICGLRPSSLNPPALSADDNAAAKEKLSFLLLEFEAYIAKRDNATTAFSKMSDGKKIQVTVCTRRPPRLSYLCVHSPDAAEINWEPTILATEEQFILLRVTVGAKGQTDMHLEYYVYQAHGHGAEEDEGPSLTLLPPPPSGYFFDHTNIGILPFKDGSGYILGGLNQEIWEPDYKLHFCFYESKRRCWEKLERQLEDSDSDEVHRLHGGREYFCHVTCKVISMGAVDYGGTLAFVDLWRGIVFVSVEDSTLAVHYSGLPSPLRSNNNFVADARLYRDIAMVGKSLQFVELQVRYKASVLYVNQFVRNGWMAVTWTLENSRRSLWVERNRIMDSQDLKVHPELYYEVLPKVMNDEGATLPPFKGLDVNQPVLSLDGGSFKDTIYFTAKRSRGNTEGWVICVDLENKELLAACSFPSQRYNATNFAYIHSRISMHLKYPGVEEKYLEEAPKGTSPLRSTVKKHSALE